MKKQLFLIVFAVFISSTAISQMYGNLEETMLLDNTTQVFWVQKTLNP